MDRNLEPWNYKTNLDNQGSLSCPEWKFWINFFITKKLEKLLVVFQFYLSNRGSINCALKQRGPMRFHLVSFKKFNEENFKFYVLAFTLGPLLFYLPKFFEIRTETTLQAYTKTLNCTEVLDSTSSIFNEHEW